jgi:hypothetical protein
LQESLLSLIQLADYVYKTDKALVYWVEKGKPVKLLLRCIGVDKRTDALVARKTTKVKKEVGRVEEKFKKTSTVFGDGLKAVQGLNTRVTEYSISSIGTVHDNVNGALEEFDNEAKQVQATIDEKDKEYRATNIEITEVSEGISTADINRKTAEQASENASDVSCTPIPTSGFNSVDVCPL